MDTLCVVSNIDSHQEQEYIYIYIYIYIYMYYIHISAIHQFEGNELLYPII